MTHGTSTASDDVPRRVTPWAWGLGLLTLVAGNASIAVSQIALGLTLVALLSDWWRAGRRPPATGLEWPALLLAGWALLMIPFSTDPGQSLLFYKRFYLFTAIWVFADLAVGESRRSALLWALAGGAALFSAVGMIDLWRSTGALFRLRLEQVSNAMTSGALLMLVLLLLLGMLLVRGQRWRPRLALGLVLLPIVLALVHTMTRSALLGLMCGMVVMLLLARPRWAVVGAGALLLIVLVTLLFGDRFLPIRLRIRLDPQYLVQGKNTMVRLEMWRGGWAIVKARPLTGVGDRDLAAVAPRYYGDEDTKYFGHLHSNPVQLAVIWGLPGFVLAMAFLITQLVLLWRRWRAVGGASGRAPPWLAGWLLGAIGAWCGFFVAGLTEWYFGDAEPMLIYLAIMGIALGDKLPAPQPQDGALDA